MEVIRKLHPDLVIVDLSLPGANGIELIKNIRAEYPEAAGPGAVDAPRIALCFTRDACRSRRIRNEA